MAYLLAFGPSLVKVKSASPKFGPQTQPCHFCDPYGVFRLLFLEIAILSRRFAHFWISNLHIGSPTTRAPSKKCVFPEGFARFGLHTLWSRFRFNLHDHVFITSVRSAPEDIIKMLKMLVGVVKNEHPLSWVLAMSWFFPKPQSHFQHRPQFRFYALRSENHEKPP